MAFVRKVANNVQRTFAAESPAGPNTPEALRKLAQENGIDTAPLDVERLADALGLVVLYESLDESISGYLEKSLQGWKIGVSAYQHPTRQKFTIAHELAHYVLHRDMQAKFEDEPFARRTGSGNQMERDADQFAAELLMPEKEFKDAIDKGINTLTALSAIFGTSMMAVRYRAKLLGLVRRSE